MTCGKHLPGRLGRLEPDGIRYLFPQLADLPDKYLYGSLWSTRESAQQSNALNAANHGHAGRTHGPLQTTIGWATAIDLRQAMLSAEHRADRLTHALTQTRGQPANLAAHRKSRQ